MLLLEGVKSALISGETNLAERRYNIEKFKEENEDEYLDIPSFVRTQLD